MTALMLLVALADPPAATAPPKEVDYEAVLNDKLAVGVTPETNANVLLWQAFGPRPEGGTGMPPEFYKRLGVAELPAQGDYLIDIGRFARERLKTAPDDIQKVFDQQDEARKRPWKPADHPQVAAWLAANEKPLAVAVEASKRPHYYNPLVSRKGADGSPGSLIGVLLPGVQKSREIAAALTCRAMLRLGEGKPDAAWADLFACHRLGRLVGRGGTLIEGLVGYAIDAIAAGAELAHLEHATLTAAQVKSRLKDLQGLPPVPPVADKIDVVERNFYLDCLRLIRTGDGNLDTLLGDAKPRKPTPADKERLAMIDWEPAVADGAAWYDRLAAAARQPTRAERVKALAAIEAELKAMKATPPGTVVERALGLTPTGKDAGKQIGRVLIGLVLPAAGKVVDAQDRATQTGRNLLVAFALAAHRAETGAYPKRLADLAPGYLKEVPDDLFSGRPLVYQPAADGYLLYSVGVNGTDDGGKTFGDQPTPGDDLRVKVPAGG